MSARPTRSCAVRPPWWRARWVAGLVVALIAWGPVAASLHLALVRHVVCPDHGEQLHADTPVVVVVESAAGRTRELGARSAPSPADGDHDHEDCLLLASTRRSTLATLSVRKPTTGDPAARSARMVPPELGRGASRETYRLAPKTSPPA